MSQTRVTHAGHFVVVLGGWAGWLVWPLSGLGDFSLASVVWSRPCPLAHAMIINTPTLNEVYIGLFDLFNYKLFLSEAVCLFPGRGHGFLHGATTAASSFAAMLKKTNRETAPRGLLHTYSVCLFTRKPLPAGSAEADP